MLSHFAVFHDDVITMDYPAVLRKRAMGYTWTYRQKKHDHTHDICMGVNVFDDDEEQIFTLRPLVWSDPLPDELRETIEWKREKDTIARGSLESRWVYQTVGEIGQRYNWYALFELQEKVIFFEVLRLGTQFDANAECGIWRRCAKSLRLRN